MAQYFDNVDLKSEIRKFDVDVLNYKMIFYSDNGVFCKEHLDYGTKLLLTSIPWKEVTGNILDVGCGYGPIGIFASKVTGNSVTMCDINKRALHLAKMNIKENKVNNCNAFVSNVYENIDKKYDFIITNPPIRAGKDIVYKILKEAKDYLKENGCLYYVINKDQGALSSIKEMEKIAKVEILEKNKGFYIIKCVF